MNRRLLDGIVRYGQEYHDTLLAGRYDPSVLQQDWWQAFDFFLGHACFQGRGDDVSELVHDSARDVLGPLFAADTSGRVLGKHKADSWHEIDTQLRDRIGRGKVGKARDVDMIVTALSYISALPGKNIVAHSVAEFRAGRLRQHYDGLQGRNGDNGMAQVGPKIAAFYLRDVVSLFSLPEPTDWPSAVCLQPIDVWVRRVLQTIGPDDAGTHALADQLAIVRMCETERVSAVRFNQGAWYMGSKAFELLVRLWSQ
jgi:hypothetical protein